MNKILILLVTIIYLSCINQDGEEKPEWLLEKDKMIGFLIDLHLTEAKLTKLGVKRDSTQKLFKAYERELFEKHQINDSLYYQSYNYYLEDMKEMKDIYVAVVDSLNVREQLLKQNSTNK